VKTFEVGPSDITLVQDTGGTGCPAQYYFITSTAKGATSSHPFGTCSDLIAVHREADKIIVTIPGFKGPLEQPAAQAKAAKESKEALV
jgi:hypothetical protein